MSAIFFSFQEMEELACCLLYNEPVVEIKSFSPSLFDKKITLKGDENNVYILHKTVISVFNGNTLIHSLNKTRSDFKKENSVENQKKSFYAPFNFEKYCIVDHDKVNDVLFLNKACGSFYESFDGLVNTFLR